MHEYQRGGGGLGELDKKHDREYFVGSHHPPNKEHQWPQNKKAHINFTAQRKLVYYC